mgnify:CR=1 FL=1
MNKEYNFMNLLDNYKLKKAKEYFNKYKLCFDLKKLIFKLGRKGYISTIKWISKKIKFNFKELFQKFCDENLFIVAKWIYDNNYIKSFNITNDMFIFACSRNSLEIIKFLYRLNPKINVSISNDYAFRSACIRSDFEIIDYLLEIKPDINISYNQEENFRNACLNGNLELVKKLLTIKPDINISILDEYAFRFAAQNGHLDVLKYLYEKKPDIDIGADNHHAIRWGCFNGNYDLVIWLSIIRPNLYSIVKEGNYLKYKINYINKIDNLVKVKEQERCGICLEYKTDIITSCKHQFCKSCLESYFNQINKVMCPYCRQENIKFNNFVVE